MRLIKPGLTGLAQITLGYDGSVGPDANLSPGLARFMQKLKDEDADDGESGTLNTRMFGNKLMFDLSYSAIMENPVEGVRTDLEILVKTPIVMIKGMGR